MAPAKKKSETPDSDIPAKAKESKKKPAAAEPDEEEDEEEEEEEYIVEKILSHGFDGPTNVLLYEVKWENYDETTWEPLENVEGLEELDEYHKRIGGTPKRKESPGKDATGSAAKKRKLDETPSAPTTSATKANRGNKQAKAKDNSSNGKTASKEPEKHVPPKGTWENDVVCIDTIVRDEKTGKLLVYVLWKNNNRSVHHSAVVNQKCPQKMLNFYEAHLQFTPAKAPKDVMDANGDMVQARRLNSPFKDSDVAPELATDSPATPAGQNADHVNQKLEDDGDDEEMDVKGVASGGVKDVAMTG